MCHTKMRWKRETHAVRGREDGEGRHTTVTEREERGGRHTQSEEEEIVEGDTHTHTHPNTHTHIHIYDMSHMYNVRLFVFFLRRYIW